MVEDPSRKHDALDQALFECEIHLGVDACLSFHSMVSRTDSFNIRIAGLGYSSIAGVWDRILQIIMTRSSY